MMQNSARRQLAAAFGVFGLVLVVLLIASDSHGNADEESGFLACVSCKSDEKSLLKEMRRRFEERRSILRDAESAQSGALTKGDRAFLASVNSDVDENRKLTAGLLSPAIDHHDELAYLKSHVHVIPMPDLMSKRDNAELAALKKSAEEDEKLLHSQELMTPEERKFVAQLQARTAHRDHYLNGFESNLITKSEREKIDALKAEMAKRQQWINKQSPI